MTRAASVGASEVAAILGCDPYRTAADVWRAKVLGEAFVENEHMVRGKCLESGLLDWWERLDGRKLRRQGGQSAALSQDPRQVQVVHPNGWAAATLDGITEDGSTVVEMKCPVGGKSWDDRSGAHPFHYRIQVLWQIGVAQASGLPVVTGELCAGPLWGKLQRHRVDPDSEFFASALRRAAEFMTFVRSGEALPASFGATLEQHT